MSGESTSLSLLHDEGRTGLLLWATEDESIPAWLRSPFLRGRWRTGVPMLGVGEEGRPERRQVDGWWLPAERAAAALAPVSLTSVDRLPPSIAVWALASKWVVEAVMREQLVPSLDSTPDPSEWKARWRVAPVRPEDRSRLAGLAAAMPGVARACPVKTNGGVQGDRFLTAHAALREYLDAAADGLVRAATEVQAPHPAQGPGWAMRLGRALAGPKDTFRLEGLADRHLPEALARWIGPATAVGGSRPIVGFRLEEPGTGQESWAITYHLLDPNDGTRIPVDHIARKTDVAVEVAGRMTSPVETLIEALGRCSRVYAPIGRSLSERMPASVRVDASEAWSFLTKAATQLQRAGYWVDVPSALSKVGRRRLRARMRLGGDAPPDRSSGLLSGAIQFRWEASLGDDTLTGEEFRKLAASKAPLVLHRGQWVAIDPSEVERLRKLMEQGGGELDASEALRLALAGEVAVPDSEGELAEVVGDGQVKRALEILQSGLEKEIPEGRPPMGFHGTMRPYQKRGLAWLTTVTGSGFGACLADDMGLGKTIQLLALAQQMAEEGKGRKTLVVCPTSVIGNWRREVRRFTPGLDTLIHHGPGRSHNTAELKRRMRGTGRADGVIVITSYSLARRDIDVFRDITFDLVVLDEAQNIKNPEAAQSRAVRELVCKRRAALTGTPVENRLTELWSIIDFLNPGLLGSRSSFKKTFAIPIERYGDEEAAEKLRRVTAPFVLRRLKVDPSIAPDLPEKSETVRYCPLTREQAALYQAALDEAMEDIAGMQFGIERRGRILAMLTALKQICNHPAQYLRDRRHDPRRSGKLLRFLELTDEVLDVGGHPLVFTQYREMGAILKDVLERRLGRHIPFYHGGLPRTARERVVAEFQSPYGPPALIVSLKAGGTGLNLTRANHVFHYDRWWNPAVEDQATDRAFRIGQTRDVTVHRLVSQGTLEEQIHQILEEKRTLADRVVGTGETWLSELDDATLRELVSLGQDAVVEEEP